MYIMAFHTLICGTWIFLPPLHANWWDKLLSWSQVNLTHTDHHHPLKPGRNISMSPTYQCGEMPSTIPQSCILSKDGQIYWSGYFNHYMKWDCHSQVMALTGTSFVSNEPKYENISWRLWIWLIILHINIWGLPLMILRLRKFRNKNWPFSREKFREAIARKK